MKRLAKNPAKGSLFFARLATAAVGAAVVGGCASTESASTISVPTYDDCFFARALSDWRSLDDSNLILFASGRRPYHVELVRPAMNLRGNIEIGVYDRDGRICPYGGDAIIVDGFMPERITIRSIRRLTEDELQEVYVQFGIRPPVVVETEAVELEERE